MNGIHKTSSQILDAFNEFGEDTRYCTECKEFHYRSDPAHYEHSRYSYDDLRVAMEEAFIGEQERMGKFITAISDALGVHEEWGGGFAEERILNAINDLKRRAA